ncbi:Microtubule-associated protein, microtubule dynamics during spindle orientation [Thoreauomyces humboldtii]|nr:Microtubule-associated protein, microtubule dynamics during spindle orientation [Thoreauomyces humboldtii]
MADATEEDFSSLSLTDRLVHKSWKARQGAYDELTKLFETIDPEADAEYRKWQDYLKKMVGEANIVAQEAGLSAVLAYIANAPSASRTRSVLASMIVEKCMGSNRAGTRQKASDILLMYIEIDTADPVIEDIIPGLQHKSPKNVISCVNALREALRQFGSRVVNVKPLLKQLSNIFDHKDKNVRAEGSALAIELFRWLGPAMSASLSHLKPVQIKELQEQFDALPSEKAVPERLLRSEQAKIAAAPVATDDAGEEAEQGGSDEPEPVDAYDLAEPVNILDKMPKNFYEQLASSKWKERKEVLEALLEVARAPKLEDGRYGELVAALGKKMADVNLLVVVTAANIIQAIAAGLRTHFGQYRTMVLHPLLEKFKEKKTHVVEACRAALDAVFASITLADITEDVATFSGHKNPQVRTESLAWATRSLKTLKKPPAKAEVKSLAEAFAKAIEDGDAGVREAAAESFGTLMKVVSERALVAFTDKIDPARMVKVKDFCEKAEVKAALAAPKKAPAAPVRRATVASIPVNKPKARSPSLQEGLEKENSPPVARAKTMAKAPSKPPQKRPASAAPKAASGAKKAVSKGDEPITYRFTDATAEAAIEELAGTDTLKGLSDGAWKIRLAAAQDVLAKLQAAGKDEIEPEAISRALSNKPGWKESNFQVMTTMINVFQYLAKEYPKYNTACGALVIPALVEKLGDMKVKRSAGDCLTTISEKLSFQFVLAQAYDPMKSLKSPKMLADALMWIQGTLLEFGTAGLAVRDLIEFVKTALGNTNPAVRTNAVAVMGTIRLFTGPDIRQFVLDLNPQLLVIIDAEFEKAASRPAPQITKQVAVTAASADVESEEAVDPADDLFPRIDILPEIIAGNFISMLGDAQWKLRKEALDEIAKIVEATNKRVQPNLGVELIPALKGRLTDSNKNLAMNAVELIGNLALAVGKPFERHSRVLVGPMVALFGDQKAHVRGAALTALENLYNATGQLDSLVAPLGTSLMAEQPQLRKDLLKWMGEKMDANPSKLPDLQPLVHPILACLQDKNADVRKGAQTVLVHVSQSVGYESLRDKCGDLFRGASLATVIPFVEAVKPAGGRPLSTASAAQATTPTKQRKSIPSAAPLARANSSAPARKTGTSRPSSSSAAPQKREVVEVASEGSAPILSSDLRGKEQRALGDKGMNKWTFDIPRPELVEHLAEQCQGQFSVDVLAGLFAADHYKEKGFLAALTALDEPISNLPTSLDQTAAALDLDVDELTSRYINSADLILKYITLRFFDTNTSMFLKCLDLIEHLLALLDHSGAQLSEYEAAAFLPFFVNKTGDPKETMRVKMRGIMRQLTRVYPASKLFNYLIRGLESKNARTRTECLEELANLVNRNGINVCVPAKAFPLVAVQLADRDASVRNGALAVLSQAYKIVGDQVYKHLGRVAAKEKSLVEERLKRMPSSARNPPTAARRLVPSSPRTGIPTASGSSAGSSGNVSPQDSHRQPPASRLAEALGGRLPLPASPGARVHTNDLHHDAASNGTARPKPRIFSLEMAEFEKKMPKVFSPAKPPASRLQPASLSSSPQPEAHGDYPHRNGNFEKPASLSLSTEQTPYKMDMLLTRITNNDIHVAVDALRQLERTLENHPEEAMQYVNEFVPALTIQARVAVTTLLAAPVGGGDTYMLERFAKHLIAALVSIFASGAVASGVVKEKVKLCLNEMIMLVQEPVLTKPDASEAFRQIKQSINHLILRILDKVNRNWMYSICFSLLMDSTETVHQMRRDPTSDARSFDMQLKHQDTLKRCVWKMAKHNPPSLSPNRLFRDVQQLLSERSAKHWSALAKNEKEASAVLAAIKVTVHRLVADNGDRILTQLDGIEREAYLYEYVLVCHAKQSEKRKIEGGQPDGIVDTPPIPDTQTPQPRPKEPVSRVADGDSDSRSVKTERISAVQPPSAAPSARPSVTASSRSSTTTILQDTNGRTAPLFSTHPSPARDRLTRPVSVLIPPHTDSNEDPAQLFERRWPADRIAREFPPESRLPQKECEQRISSLFARLRVRASRAQAMEELQRFREEHPYIQAAIDAELQKSASFYQTYMRRELAKDPATLRAAASNPDMKVGDPSEEIQETFAKWRKEWADSFTDKPRRRFNGFPDGEQQQRVESPDRQSTNITSMYPGPERYSSDEIPSVVRLPYGDRDSPSPPHATTARPGAGPMGLAALKARLGAMKENTRKVAVDDD